MRQIGFSTGAIALSNFRRGIQVLAQASVSAIELSALRAQELAPLLSAIQDDAISESFEYVSVHAPSSFEGAAEARIVESILAATPESWPVVLHPDASQDLSLWASFGNRLLIENMDRRKPCARTLSELRAVFERLPEASFCFDIGHAHQVDRTMLEAAHMLAEYGSRLRQVHVSEVNTASRHERLSDAAILAFRKVADLIPEEAVLILETPTPEAEIHAEMDRVAEIFVAQPAAVAW